MNKDAGLLKAVKIDPRPVFAFVTFLGIGAVAVREAVPMLPFTAVAFAGAVAIKVDFFGVWHKMRRLFYVLISVAVLQGLFQPTGTVLLQVFGLSVITTGGLMVSAAVLQRLVIMILGGSMLSRFSGRVLIQGFVQMKMPYELAYMISIGIRFIPLLSQELRESLIAIQLRGVDFERQSWRQRIRIYVYLLLPCLAGAIYKAGQLSKSMETRGFRAFPDRTSFFTLKLRVADYALFTLVAAMSVLSVWYFVVYK